MESRISRRVSPAAQIGAQSGLFTCAEGTLSFNEDIHALCQIKATSLAGLHFNAAFIVMPFFHCETARIMIGGSFQRYIPPVQ